jgi:hypothetical protein
MVAQYTKPLPEERFYADLQVEAHQVLSRFPGRQAPPPLPGEQLDTYDRRLTYEMQKVAPNYKDLNLYEARGDTYKLMKEQIKADALKEAHHPTQIPEGELREVVTHDQSGRPMYSYYGSPRAWMDHFAPPKKMVVGIRNNLKFPEV